MTTFLSISEKDNSDFINNIEIILRNRLSTWRPFIVGVTKIDNWFDSKWLKFSGQIMPGLTVWQKEVTRPPFNPNRILSEDYYKRLRQTGEYEMLPRNGTLHKHQPSRFNIDNKITNILSDGLLIWYSGNTATNSIGCVMAYYVKGKECFTFYTALSKETKWTVSKSIGLTEKDIRTIFSEMPGNE